MKFFFPDSQDQVDPSFNFETEERSDLRLRHRDDRYAHEEFASTPFDGILLSMAIERRIPSNGVLANSSCA